MLNEQEMVIMFKLLSVALVSLFVFSGGVYAGDMKKDAMMTKGDTMKKDAMAKKDEMMSKGDGKKKDAHMSSGMKKDSMNSDSMKKDTMKKMDTMKK